jgi:hypothetical protein
MVGLGLFIFVAFFAVLLVPNAEQKAAEALLRVVEIDQMLLLLDAQHL